MTSACTSDWECQRQLRSKSCGLRVPVKISAMFLMISFWRFANRRNRDSLDLIIVGGASGVPHAPPQLPSRINADKQPPFRVAISEFRKVTELEPKLTAGFVNFGECRS